MDNNIFNKIDKSQLTKIETNLAVKKDNLDLKEKIDANILVEEGDNYTPPCIGPARYNTIDLDSFQVTFDTPCFIEQSRVISITKPIYNIRKEKYVSNKVMLAFSVYHAVHFFGKPNRYDNFFTDEEIVTLINQFNEEKHKYMKVVELDANGEGKIKTIYTAPRIYRIEFPPFDVTKTDTPKYFIAEVHFNHITQEVLMPVEPEVIEENDER